MYLWKSRIITVTTQVEGQVTKTPKYHYYCRLITVAALLWCQYDIIIILVLPWNIRKLIPLFSVHSYLNEIAVFFFFWDHLRVSGRSRGSRTIRTTGKLKSQDVGEARRSAATVAYIASSLPYAGGLHFFFHVRSIVTGRLVAWADGRPGWLRAVMKAACLHAVGRQVRAAVCHVAFSPSFPSHIVFRRILRAKAEIVNELEHSRCHRCRCPSRALTGWTTRECGSTWGEVWALIVG